jgi:nucleotide-binding universal stress UspA family protein
MPANREAAMYKKILVPVDGSAASQRGLAEAISLAKGLNASLRLVHVVNEFVMDSAYAPATYLPSLIDALREAGTRTLKDAEAAAIAQGLKPEIDLMRLSAGARRIRSSSRRSAPRSISS